MIIIKEWHKTYLSANKKKLLIETEIGKLGHLNKCPTKRAINCSINFQKPPVLHILISRNILLKGNNEGTYTLSTVEITGG